MSLGLLSRELETSLKKPVIMVMGIRLASLLERGSGSQESELHAAASNDGERK